LSKLEVNQKEIDILRSTNKEYERRLEVSESISRHKLEDNERNLRRETAAKKALMEKVVELKTHIETLEGSTRTEAKYKEMVE
jgi:hypothetical protein